MAAQKVLLVLIGLMLVCHTVESCQRKDSPCGENECCFLVLNLRLLSYSFCWRRNRDNDKCAQNDYCLLDSDCDTGGVCEGATASKWGRCQGSLNPCLDKQK